MNTFVHYAQLAIAFYKANSIAIGAVVVAALGWWGNLFSAFTTSLPDPDNPADWGPQGKFLAYKLFFKTMRQWNNQKSPNLPPGVHLQPTTGAPPPPKL